MHISINYDDRLMFEAILLGMGAGLISSFLTGPVFFAMIKTSIEKGFMAGFSLALGVIFSDVILIALVLFGSQFLVYQDSFDKYVGLFGGIFLLAVLINMFACFESYFCSQLSYTICILKSLSITKTTP